MSARYFHIGLVALILAAGRIGFGESFPNRPTASGMGELVTLGTECAKGVNERCWATQYATNPVQYYVSPFTNNSNWYLDKDLMGAMASKARSLAPYYADTNTVYDGTTNIVMLAVTGVWAQLQIGDRTNQFTQTPAAGTNNAVYGDYPWRIYNESLDERYKVLEALKICYYSGTTNVVTNAPAPPGISAVWSNTAFMWGGWEIWNENPSWETVKTETENNWDSYPGNWGYAPGNWSEGVKYIPPYGQGDVLHWEAGLYAVKGMVHVGPFPTNGQEYSLIVKARSVRPTDGYGIDHATHVYISEFTSAGAVGAENEWVEIINVTNATVQWQDSAVYGSDSMPTWCVDPTPDPYGMALKGNIAEKSYQTWYGPQPSYTNTYTNWVYIPSMTNFLSTNIWPQGFSYCTGE